MRKLALSLCIVAASLAIAAPAAAAPIDPGRAVVNTDMNNYGSGAIGSPRDTRIVSTITIARLDLLRRQVDSVGAALT